MTTSPGRRPWSRWPACWSRACCRWCTRAPRHPPQGDGAREPWGAASEGGRVGRGLAGRRGLLGLLGRDLLRVLGPDVVHVQLTDLPEQVLEGGLWQRTGLAEDRDA